MSSCSFIFTGLARICAVTMSHVWIYSWCEKKAIFFNFLIANEPAERRRSAGEAAENSAARRMLYAEKFSNDV